MSATTTLLCFLSVVLLGVLHITNAQQPQSQGAWMYEVFTDQDCSSQAFKVSGPILNVGWDRECLLSETSAQSFVSTQIPGNETAANHNFGCNATCDNCAYPTVLPNGECYYAAPLKVFTYVFRLEKFNMTMYQYRKGTESRVGGYGLNCTLIDTSSTGSVTVEFGVCKPLPNGKYEVLGKNYDSTTNRWGYGLAGNCDDPLCSVNCAFGSFYFADTQCMQTSLYGLIGFQSGKSAAPSGAVFSLLMLVASMMWVMF